MKELFLDLGGFYLKIIGIRQFLYYMWLYANIQRTDRVAGPLDHPEIAGRKSWQLKYLQAKG